MDRFLPPFRTPTEPSVTGLIGLDFNIQKGFTQKDRCTAEGMLMSRPQELLVLVSMHICFALRAAAARVGQIKVTPRTR